MRGGRVAQAKRSRGAGGRAAAVARDDGSDTNTIDPALDGNSVSEFSTDATEPSDTTDAGETSDAVDTVATEIDHLGLAESELRALQVCDFPHVVSFNISYYIGLVHKNLSRCLQCRRERGVAGRPFDCSQKRGDGRDLPVAVLPVRRHASEESKCMSSGCQASNPRPTGKIFHLTQSAELLHPFQDEESSPSGLRRGPHEPRPTWDLALMKELAKESFRNLKPSLRRRPRPTIR